MADFQCAGDSNMKIIYLDQNKWIDLARSYHGKDNDPDLKATLSYLLQETKQGSIVLPLSATHYMEIARIRDPQRRSRLGTVMWELSGGTTIGSYRAMLIHELECALARRFAHVHPTTFTLLARGLAHATGVPIDRYRIPEPARSQLPTDEAEAFEKATQEEIERSTVTGQGPGGIQMPQFGISQQNHDFKNHLDTLLQKLSSIPRTQWDDALIGISLMDIQEPLNEVLERNRLTLLDLVNRGKDDTRRFVEELPSHQADLQLHRQIIRNPKLKSKLTDLDDWAGLGPATAYCDFVVCENHFADLLLRDGFRPRATIARDIRALPDLLKT
jgi:hypothetical protein